ncbi:MAG: acyl-CoA thioesterase II [Chitinophagales bacterium]|nr:acyl-CoA thioesterase II [Chitinophagales bacterium]
MNSIKEWLEEIDLEKVDKNIYKGYSHDMGSPQVYGGQVLSQGLHAAMLTVPEERTVHSTHAYFLLPGDLDKPIIYQVDRLRDGGSFTTRRIVAIQDGQAIFNMAASFQHIAPGLEHQIEMPDVKKPDELLSDFELLKKFKDQIPEGFKSYLRERPIEVRPVDPLAFIVSQKHEPFRHVWFKMKGDKVEDKRILYRLLAYASDYTLLTTAIQPHQDKVRFDQIQFASLDHAMWFHREFDMEDWMLYAIDSPSASNSRGFTRGNIFSHDGKLVASVVQEGLLRVRL